MEKVCREPLKNVVNLISEIIVFVKLMRSLFQAGFYNSIAVIVYTVNYIEYIIYIYIYIYIYLYIYIYIYILYIYIYIIKHAIVCCCLSTHRHIPGVNLMYCHCMSPGIVLWCMSLCHHVSLFVDTGDCQQGYYCTISAYLDTPNDNTTGAICPLYHVCVTGSPAPVLCPIGYMANRTGMYACEMCIAGFLCLPGEAPRVCPQGKFLSWRAHKARWYLV